MEAFSLLKYWRGGGGLAARAATAADTISATEHTPNGAAAAILTAVAENAIETDDDNDNDNDNDEDGPFFDLEFTVPDEADDSEDGYENPNGNHSGRDTAHHSEEEEEDDDDDDNEESEGDDGEREFKFTLSPSSNDRSDPNLPLSPSDDLFFKGKLVQLEPSSFVLNPCEPNSKPQFTASLLKSATKFRVFMLGLKKSKSNIASDKETNASDSVAPNPKQPQCQQQQRESQKKQPETQQRKLFTVKFKVEEVPIMSLFTRDNSSRGGGSANKSSSQNQKHNTEELPSSASDEKRFSKEVMQKYLKMVKPLYIRVSRRYGDKLKFSGQLKLSSGPDKAGRPPATAALKPDPAKAAAEKAQTEEDACETTGTNMKGQKQGNLPAGLRVVCKHLGKSRSASSAVASAPSGLVSSRRRDDSLLQQQDGIQGAILHCKRSFNASRECESSQLPRSVSDSLHEISPELSRKSTNEGKNKRL